jgi:hypothetical protein
MLTPETRASTVSRFAPVGDVQDADSVVVRELFQRDALCGSAQYPGVSTARVVARREALLGCRHPVWDVVGRLGLYA